MISSPPHEAIPVRKMSSEFSPIFLVSSWWGSHRKTLQEGTDPQGLHCITVVHTQPLAIYYSFPGILVTGLDGIRRHLPHIIKCSDSLFLYRSLSPQFWVTFLPSDSNSLKGSRICISFAVCLAFYYYKGGNSSLYSFIEVKPEVISISFHVFNTISGTQPK